MKISSRKFIIIMLAASLLLVVAVVLIVHEEKADEPEPLEIEKNAAAIGTWISESESGDASGDEESTQKDANYALLTFDEEGNVEGEIGQYEFNGTWQQKSENVIRILNSKDDPAYEAEIDGNKMKLAGTDTTNSFTWDLTKSE